MNKASIIRYGAATALGLAMSAALLNALGAGNKVTTSQVEGNFAEMLAVDSSQALQAIDLNMAAMAQTLVAATTLSNQSIPTETFKQMSNRFFALTEGTQGIAFFRIISDKETAEKLAAPNAESIAQFENGGTGFYLAATQKMQDDRVDGSRLAFSGPGGRLPLSLVSSLETRERMGQALTFDLPLSSSLFQANSNGIQAVESTPIGGEGTTGFWRMVSVRSLSQNGQAQSLGVLAAFVDASAVFNAKNLPPLTITGPLGVTSLPDPGAYSHGGGIREVAVSSGNQGFTLGYQPYKKPLPVLSWLFALLGGLIAAGTTLYAMTHGALKVFGEITSTQKTVVMSPTYSVS